MQVLLFNNPQLVTEEELAHDLNLLPEWRREKALKFRFLIDRVLSTKAYLLLKQGLQQGYGIETNPTFDYIKNDKPVLREFPDIHFNLSHCKKGVLCVIDDHPVGCDIEAIPTQLNMSLCNYCHQEQEVNHILQSEKPTMAFTELWTRKEALVKLVGTGLNDNLKQMLTSEVATNVQFATVCKPDLGYVYSICSMNGLTEPTE